MRSPAVFPLREPAPVTIFDPHARGAAVFLCVAAGFCGSGSIVVLQFPIGINFTLAAGRAQV